MWAIALQSGVAWLRKPKSRRFLGQCLALAFVVVQVRVGHRPPGPSPHLRGRGAPVWTQPWCGGVDFGAISNPEPLRVGCETLPAGAAAPSRVGSSHAPAPRLFLLRPVLLRRRRSSPPTHAAASHNSSHHTLRHVAPLAWLIDCSRVRRHRLSPSHSLLHRSVGPII